MRLDGYPSALPSKLPGVFTGVLGGLTVFLAWRLLGLPLPGTLGRLVPLAWLLAGTVSPRARRWRCSLAFLAVFAIVGAAWPLGRAVLLVSLSAAAAGVIALLEPEGPSNRSAMLAMLPLAPLVILLVPFTGDEPYYAAVAASIVQDGDLDASDDLRQYDPVAAVSPEIADAEGLSHFQPAFPLLILPGVLLGLPGFRIAALIVTAASASLVALMLAREGTGEHGRAAVLSVLLLPGAAVAGLAYPDFAAAGLVALGAVLSSRGRFVPVVLCALALALLKLRFAAAGAGLVAAALSTMSPRRRLAWMAAGLILLACILLADRTVLGGRLFWMRYGNVESLAVIWHRTVSTLPDIVFAPLWMLLDQEAGLLWRAPWLLPAAFGLARCLRGSPLARPLVLSSAAYLAVLVLWQPLDWHSCPTPWGRPFMPLLPLFALGMAHALSSGRGGGFFALSALVSGACLVMPDLRFNYLDGTDRILEWVAGAHGTGTGAVLPSMLRPDAAVATGWAAVWAVSAILYGRGREGAALAVLPLALVLFSSIQPTVPTAWEAEDLPPQSRVGCSLFPASPDPRERISFEGSRERMLCLSAPGDAVLLPAPPGQNGEFELRLRLRALTRGEPLGLSARCGGSTARLLLSTGMREPPSWVRAVRRGDTGRNPEPGNLRDTTVVVTLTGGPGEVIGIFPSEPLPVRDLEGIYLDRIEVRRR